MRKKSGREPGREPVETPEEIPGEVQVSDQQLETYERIEEIKERFGDDATGRAQIQRRLKDGRLIGLPSIPALTFDTDLVAKRYGGGRYYVRFFQGRQYRGDIEFELDEALKPEPEPTPAAAVVHTTGGDVAPSWLAAVLDKIADAAKEFAARPAPTPPDPIAMIEKLSSAMRALQPPAPAAQPRESLKDQLALVESIVNVGTKIVDARGEGGGESGDVYMAAVSKLADPIVELVKARAQQEALRGQPRRAALPSPVPGPVPPQPEQQPAAPAAAGGPVWLMEVQRWLPLIVKRQQKQLSAEDTAYFVLDEFTEPALAGLAEFLARENAQAELQQVLPAELKADPAWLSEFLAAVNDYLLGEEADVTGPGDDVRPGAPILDLEAEAEKRLGKLRDKPQEQAQEQALE